MALVEIENDNNRDSQRSLAWLFSNSYAEDIVGIIGWDLIKDMEDSDYLFLQGIRPEGAKNL